MTLQDDVIWELRSEEVLKAIKQNSRLDGRGMNDYRKAVITTNISQNADGSARVELGETMVVSGVKMLTGTPYPDSPDEGSISVGVELLALASPTFEVGPPRDESIELSRVVDRGIRESKTIDFTALCITPGEMCWVVYIDGYVLNDSGNLFDASSIASIAALLNTKVPKMEGNKIVKGEYAGKLKLANIPLLTTFAKLGNQVVVDPNLAEMKSLSARLSIATFEGKKMSAMQKGLAGSFTVQEVDQCIDLALAKGDEVRQLLRKL